MVPQPYPTARTYLVIYAWLIALFFMHLKFDRPAVWLLPGIPVLLGIAFVLALFPDIVWHATLRM